MMSIVDRRWSPDWDARLNGADCGACGVAVKPSFAMARVRGFVTLEVSAVVPHPYSKTWRGRDGNDPSFDIAKDAERRF